MPIRPVASPQLVTRPVNPGDPITAAGETALRALVQELAREGRVRGSERVLIKLTAEHALGAPFWDWDEVQFAPDGGSYTVENRVDGRTSDSHGPAWSVNGAVGQVSEAVRLTSRDGNPIWVIPNGGAPLVRGTITDVHGFDGDPAGDVTYDAASEDGAIVLTNVAPTFRAYGDEVAVSIALIDDVCWIDPSGDEPTLAITTEKLLSEDCDGTLAYTYDSGANNGLNPEYLVIDVNGNPVVDVHGNLVLDYRASASETAAWALVVVADDGRIVFDVNGNPVIADGGASLVDPDAFDLLVGDVNDDLVVDVSNNAVYSPLTPLGVAQASPTSVRSIVAQSASAGTPTGVYVKADGTQALSANWDAGSHKITAAQMTVDTDGSAAAPPFLMGTAVTKPGWFADAGDLCVSVGGAEVSRWTDDPYFIPPDQGQTDAFAIGNGTTVNGIECVAIGNGSQAWNASSLGGSVAIGYAANAGNGAVARNKTVAIGAESAATHNSAIAIGYQATASGANTIAIGAGVTASALGPVVGYSCTATGTQALGAFGYTAVAGKTRSFALGFASAISANDFVIGDRGAANTTPRIVGIGCAGTAFQNCAMWYIQPSWKVSTNATRQSDAELGTFYSSSNTAIPAMRLFNDTARGYVAMKAQTTAPADSDLNNGEVAFWIDGSGNLAIKYKDGSGTVTNGSVALA